MFCPKCGQRQVSDDVRFCFACGAKLGTGAEALTKRIIALLMYMALTALALSGWGPSSGPMYTQIRALIILVSVITFLLLFSSDLKRAFSKLFRQEKDQSNQNPRRHQRLKAHSVSLALPRVNQPCRPRPVYR
jgi:uncharacterized membrane protein YvbJ